MDESRLRNVPLFASLSEGERKRIAQLADEIDLPAGKELVHEGRFSYEFFVIEGGAAEVLIGDRHVADLGPGDFFGEMGALGNVRRSADVVTTAPTTAIVMRARDLRVIAGEMPGVEQRIRTAIEERTRALSGA